MPTRLLLANSGRGVLIEPDGQLYQRFANWPDRPLAYRGPSEPILRTLREGGWLLRVLGPDGREAPELPNDQGTIPPLKPLKLPTGELVFQLAAK